MNTQISLDIQVSTVSQGHIYTLICTSVVHKYVHTCQSVTIDTGGYNLWCIACTLYISCLENPPQKLAAYNYYSRG